MTDSEPVLMCWSGGKDSSLALHAALQDPLLQIEALLTTVTEDYERISMHGVRISLLEQQARSQPHARGAAVLGARKAAARHHADGALPALRRFRHAADAVTLKHPPSRPGIWDLEVVQDNQAVRTCP